MIKEIKKKRTGKKKIRLSEKLKTTFTSAKGMKVESEVLMEK